ncbi:hypothetical protein C8Q73DRAFT_678186 [Cubamyces lactineus]|nr:hypothetical protein C8Q73DRAFT_678186 [Cubamyces lactineus]
MFSDYQLQSPPPASRFRRPWSPDPHDPLPSSSNTRQFGFDAYGPLHSQYMNERRREPSDVSVEALDLADYAQTLNRNNYHLSQQPPFHAYDPYPPSPHSSRPLARTDSLSPPSLVSASASSSHSHSFSPRSPMRRPFSLPPPSFPAHTVYSDPSTAHRFQGQHEPQIASPESEIDIAQFPSFARGWYGQERSAAHPTLSPTASMNAMGGVEAQKKSPFDPAYTFEHDPTRDPYSSPPPTYPYGSSYGSHSRYSRDQGMVPWGTDPPDSDHPIDPETKEERMRMLEREFGGKGGVKDESDPTMTVGSVDERGRLITDGPKKRLVVRWLQALLALTAAISSIYAALIIKPPSPAPPANKLPAYLLYVLSVLTFLGCTYLFLIYPCCCGARKPKDGPYTQGPGGMMVLPVQGLPGGKPKKGKKGKGAPAEGVQVNLIVDPSMFGRDSERGREDEEDWQGEDDATEAPPGSYSGASSAGRQRRSPPRRGIFAGLAMEEQWRKARKMLKWGTTVDVFVMLLWGLEFVVILLGKRCPVGGFEGWCDAYNLATAAACLLCLTFGVSLFFDVKDLHASRMSPRTRT